MAKTSVETLLHDRIDTVSDQLSSTTAGSPEHKALATELADLMDRAIAMDKVDRDCELQEEARKSDESMKKQQMEDERKDRLVKNLLGAAGIVLPLVVTIWGTKVSLKFEEEGTFTTIMGRGFVNKLLPKK